jgi:hypothetical protein
MLQTCIQIFDVMDQKFLGGELHNALLGRSGMLIPVGLARLLLTD